jgi:anti-sigma regulatory factor (Ser/Thr protein kinase)
MTGDHPPGGNGVENEFLGALDEIRLVREGLEGTLQVAGYTQEDQVCFDLPAEQGLVNAIVRVNHMDPDKWVRLRYTVEPDRPDILTAAEGHR